MIIETATGPFEESELDRIVQFQDSTDAFVVICVWKLRQQVERLREETVHRLAFNIPKQPYTQTPMGATILIQLSDGTIGPELVSVLSRKTGFEDNPNEFVVWEEWRDASGTLVKRDAHVMLKKASVTAAAIAGGLG